MLTQEQAKDELDECSRLLVSSNVDYAIITLDVAGNIRSWNEGAARIKGYEKDEIIGQHFSIFFPQKDRDSGEPARMLELAKINGRFEESGWRVHKDGKQVFSNIVITSLTDESGKLLGFGTITRDITEQQLSEKTLREQAEMLDLTHEPIMVRDLQGLIQFWNKGAEEMYGYSKEEALGQICHKLLATVFPSSLMDIQAEALINRRWDGELIHTSQAGEAVTVLSRWAVKVDASGQPCAILEIDSDIKERKTAERLGKERITELAASEELLRSKMLEIESADKARELKVKERITELAVSGELLRSKMLEIDRSDEDRKVKVKERISELAASEVLLRAKKQEIERADEDRELKIKERIVELAASEELMRAKKQEIERAVEARELKVKERIVELAASEELLRSKKQEIERADQDRELKVKERIVELAASEELLRAKKQEIERADQDRELKVKERIVELAASEELMRSKKQELERADEDRELKVKERIVELAASEELMRSKKQELERADEDRELKVKERIVELAASEELLRAKKLEIERADEDRELKVKERIVELAASEELLRAKKLEIERSDEDRKLKVKERNVELAASEELLRSKLREIEISDEDRELKVKERIVELAASEELLRSKMMEIERADEDRELKVKERIVELAASEDLLRAEKLEIERADEDRKAKVQERIIELAASEKLLQSKVLEIERADVARELKVQERIVELAESEKLLHSKVLELERSNEELQQFAYICSHDLQEPLRVVSNYTQLLSKRYKGKLDDKADQFINFAVDAAKRMQDLINDLLTYSRIQTKEVGLGEVDCSQIAKMAMANLEMILAETGATVRCDSLPKVSGDKSQLLQLFQNLIGNALKFRSTEPTVIDVSVRQDGGFWVFAVHDNGIGLDMQFADRVFLIFQRLHAKEEYAGSGIGLAVCKKIVTRHGGRIWVESEPKKGSTFLFTLPVIVAENHNAL